MDIKNKKITILGIGTSGIESARFLRSQGAEVFLSEGIRNEKTEKSEKLLRDEKFDFEIGSHTESRIKEADFIVISPGIKPQTPIYQFVSACKIPFYSEIEVAAWFTRVPIVAVTGTNGKTTVTTLIAKMLSENGTPAVSCGNIGNPFIGEVDRINREHLVPVVELSSFQLMRTCHFKPHIGVVLNMEPDHLDWHEDLKEYYDAKFLMFRNQTEKDYAVLNQQDEESKVRAGSLKSRIVYFDGEGRGGSNPNWNACLKVAEIYGFDRKKTLEILEIFQGIEHRLEAVSSQDGRRYINDSKSTNISSLIWALNRMQKPVILIMGGRNKGADFGQIEGLLKKKTKHIVLIGESAEEISKSLPVGTRSSFAGSLKAALETARQNSVPEDIILLSPACASFDMFLDYKDRGAQFKNLVNQLSVTCPKTVSVS